MMPCNTGAFSVGHLRKCSYSSVPQKGKRDISQFLAEAAVWERGANRVLKKFKFFFY